MPRVPNAAAHRRIGLPNKSARRRCNAPGHGTEGVIFNAASAYSRSRHRRGVTMPPFLDLTGQRFGRLAVIERAANRGKQACWSCICDCGNAAVVAGRELRAGSTASCGCLKRDVLAKRNHRHGHASRSGWTPTYVSWKNLHQRCTDPACPDYPDYGGRGIKVCDRWSDFACFLADMGERPLARSIDRIDNGGNYEPGNCRWATSTEQAANRRPIARELPQEWEGLTHGKNGRALSTHCIHGHEYTPENTYRNGRNGQRCCRICALARARARTTT